MQAKREVLFNLNAPNPCSPIVAYACRTECLQRSASVVRVEKGLFLNLMAKYTLPFSKPGKSDHN